MKEIGIEVWSRIHRIIELFFRKYSGTRLWKPYNGGGIVVLHLEGVIEGTFLQKTKFNNDCQDCGVS